NVNVDWNITVDAFKHIVALLEWSTRDRTRSHGNHVLRVSHLVVKPHNLRRHFLRDRPGNDHQIRLARRWPENFTAEARYVVPRCGSGDHFNCATSQSKLERPDRVLATPVVQILH